MPPAFFTTFGAGESPVLCAKPHSTPLPRILESNEGGQRRRPESTSRRYRPALQPGQLRGGDLATDGSPAAFRQKKSREVAGKWPGSGREVAGKWPIGVLFGCFAGNIDGDSDRFTWFHQPGISIYFQPKRTPMVGRFREGARVSVSFRLIFINSALRNKGNGKWGGGR